MTSNEYDVTGFCTKGNHDGCSGALLGATGSHWWCACDCHPEPTTADASPFAPPAAVGMAIETFHAARSAAA